MAQQLLLMMTTQPSTQQSASQRERDIKAISVSTTADLDVEDDETFNLTITAEGTDDVPPQISDGSATVTIKADDFKRRK